MQINISNYRGCKAAAVKGSPILIIGGRNGNGKSSLLEGVALAVTRLVVPPGVAKKDAGDLLFTNAEGMRAAKGVVSVTMDTGSVHVTYPKGDDQAEGELKVTPAAAGLIRLPALPADKLAAALAGIVPSEPTLDDLLRAFKAKEIDAKTAGVVWKKVGESHWNGAWKMAQERGAALKAEWQQITGRKWGSAIGDDWRPEGWDDALLTDETSDNDVADLFNALREAERATAFDEGVLDALNEEIKALPARQKAADTAAEAEQHALEALRAAQSKLDGLPAAEESGLDLPCPHCGCFVRLDRKNAATLQLVKAEDSTHKAATIDKMRKDRASADGDLANKRTAYTDAKAAAMAAASELTASINAQSKVAEATKARSGKVDVDAARQAYEDAKNRVARREAYKSASSKHSAILGNAAIQEILAPDGLRADVLKRGIDAFNTDHLAPLCFLAGWPPVTIGADLVISWGGRAWNWLSGAEKWLTSAIMQVAVARADGSQMVILDGADICDAGNRNALFTLLPEIGIEALVGMTYNKPTQVPDLKAAGLGDRFWMRDGLAEGIEA